MADLALDIALFATAPRHHDIRLPAGVQADAAAAGTRISTGITFLLQVRRIPGDEPRATAPAAAIAGRCVAAATVTAALAPRAK